MMMGDIIWSIALPVLILSLLTSLCVGGCLKPPDADGHVTWPDAEASIPNGAFRGCGTIKSITIPEGVTTIGDNAFAWSSIKNVSLPTSITSIKNDAFKSAKRLTTVDLNDGLTSICTSAFDDATELTSIAIPDTVMQLGSSAFKGTKRLREVVLPNNRDVSTTMGKDVFKESGLVNLVIPDTWTIIPYGFCSACHQLCDLRIGSGVRIIGQTSFSNTNISDLIIPDNVKELDYAAFSFSIAMKSLVLGADLSKIYDGGFYGSVNLASIIVNSRNLEVVSSAFMGMPLLLPGYISFRRDAELIKGIQLISKVSIISCSNGTCTCAGGLGNTKPDASDYFNCGDCPLGFTSRKPLSQGSCVLCDSGYYADKIGMALCTPCGKGHYTHFPGSSSSNDCNKCPVGRYNPSIGSSGCELCPPGNWCNETGAAFYRKCDAGTYQDVGGKVSCRLCKEGTYQSSAGSAKCIHCPAGKYNSDLGSNSLSACLDCIPGKFSQNGSAPVSCELCASGQFQASFGQDRCWTCSSYYNDPTLTSSPDRTHCVPNSDLLAQTMIDVMFNDGLGLIGTFVIALSFLSVATVIQYLREKSNGQLASFSRPRTVGKSFLPGMAFGSELFLIVGIMHEAPVIGAMMLVFRLFHTITSAVLLTAMFTRSSRMTSTLNDAFQGLGTHLRRSISRDAFLHNGAVMGLTVVCSLCDMSMLQFLPFKTSKFFAESFGMPSYSFFVLFTRVSVVADLGSVICELIYLGLYSDLDNPTTSTQAKALFSINIGFSIYSVMTSFVLFFVRGALLKSVQLEIDEGASEKQGNGPDALEMGTTPIAQDPSSTDAVPCDGHDHDQKVIGRQEQSGRVSITQLFDGGRTDGRVSITDNPLHSIMGDLVDSEPSEEVSLSRAELQSIRSDLELLREENRELKSKLNDRESLM